MTIVNAHIREEPRLASWRYLSTGSYALIATALLFRVVSGSTSAASFLILAILSLIGRTQAILAMTLSWLFTMMNPELVAEGNGGTGVGRYLVIVAVASRAFIDRKGRRDNGKSYSSFVAATIFLTLFFVVHSILVSPFVDVSILKAVSWGLTMSALVSLWGSLSDEERCQSEGVIYTILILVLFASIPLLISSAGYARNGTGFQGVLNHPQVFGSTMALFGTWSGARMLSQKKPSWKSISILLASLALVILSESRTAGIAMVIGLVLSLFLSTLLSGKPLVQMAPGVVSGRIWAIVGGGLIAVVAMATAFSDAIYYFLSKSGRAESGNLIDAYENSRGFLMDAMLINIAQYPLRGIGFGIGSIPSMMLVERDELLGLPLGASIEKGIAPLAILEEVGVFGAALVVIWTFQLLRKGAVGGLAAFAVCLTALLLNMGENTLFSPGGQGLLAMILFGWAYASGSRVSRHA